ncbi:hypothetical protein ACHWQZ_G012666 [Mnemiopsis leidyi]
MIHLDHQIQTEVPESLYQPAPINHTENSVVALTPSESPPTSGVSKHTPVLENGHHETSSDSNNLPSDPDVDLISRTLQKQQIPCSVCRGSITTADGIRVGGKFYHRECFVCGGCSRNFDPSDEIFIGKNNQILCSACKLANPEEIKTVDLCVYCKKPLGSAAMVALNYKWHPECFVCTDCGVVLTGFFRDTGGVPYCEQCWLRHFAKICNTCGEPIGEQVMTIEERDYHVKCVKCQVCQKTFDNVLDILAIESDFWHVDCFKEAESESETESTCSTSSALLGIYNQSLGFSAGVQVAGTRGTSECSSSKKKSRKISTVSFTPAARPSPKPLQDEGVSSPDEVPVMPSVETNVTSHHVTRENSQTCEPLVRPQSKCSVKRSTCCVIS